MSEEVFKCPLCDGPMTIIKDESGVMVKCYNIPCDPLCHETVFGHGRTAKEAHQAAGEKFRRLN